MAPDVLDRVERRRTDSARREVHDATTATWLGVALGVAFAVCLLTGLYSHLLQHPPGWWPTVTRPAGLYRVTQGVHVATGLASVPLLLAKLYAVSPHLWRRPVISGALDGMERLALLPLVGGSVFLLGTGTANIAHWYPWPFFFPTAHFWAAVLVAGALVVHVALKAPTLRAVRSRRTDTRGVEPRDGELTRRQLVWGAAGTAGLITALTAGQTVPALEPITALAPRRHGLGPQGVPVNRTAEAAGTTGLSDGYRLVVTGPGGRRSELTLEDLRGLPQRDAELPIACVEGWSTSARWRGVRVAQVLAAVGAEPERLVVVDSAQRGGLYSSSTLTTAAIADPDCLLALELNGEPLHPDHGAPLRLIAPNRPGVLQTKWVTSLEAR